MANFNFEPRIASGYYPGRLSTKYVVPLNTLDGLTQELNNSGGAFASSTNNKLYDELQQYIYSIRYYPFDVLGNYEVGVGFKGFVDGETGLSQSALLTATDGGTMLQRIVIGDVMKTYPSDPEGDGELENGDIWFLAGAVMTNKFDNRLYLGNVYIEPKYNSFLDGQPYTKLEAFVPFAGTFELDPDIVTGRYVHCWYCVDYTTGEASVFLTHSATQDVGSGDQHALLMQGKCQLGLDIPLGQTNATELARNRYMSNLSIMGGLATGAVSVVGSAGSALPFIASTAMQALQTGAASRAQKKTFAKGTQSTAQGMLNAPNVFYITRTYSIPVNNTEAYNALYGRPACDDTHTLGQYIDTGVFFRCSDVHLNNIVNATKDEVEEIERLLKTGVIG